MEARRKELQLLELELFILRKEQSEKLVTKHRKKMKDEYHILVKDLRLCRRRIFFKNLPHSKIRGTSRMGWTKYTKVFSVKSRCSITG